MSNQIVNCPECGANVDVNKAIYQDLEAKHKAESLEKQQQLKKQEEKLKQQQDQFEQQKQDYGKIMADELAAKEKILKQELENQIKAKLENDNKAKDQQAQQELDAKSKQIKELQNTAIENEKLKREKDELEAKYKLEAQKQITKELALAKIKIAQEQQEENDLKVKELEKQLDDQKKLTAEMKRKQEQGSMQLQGEAQELILEQYLTNEFALDTIEEIKKGQCGADCLQIVNTREQQNCGSIYYESKRTKNFDSKWIEKFKADIQAKNASLGVLVTAVMPKDMPQAGYRDGIVICSFSEVKGIVGILRQWLIKVSSTAITQINKGKKQEVVYSYFISETFNRQLENILNGFNTLKDDLEKEKKQTKVNWKKREKQLERVIDNTIDIYASIKGIAGKDVPEIPELEVDDAEKLEELETTTEEE
jgi:hypothetical protein